MSRRAEKAAVGTGAALGATVIFASGAQAATFTVTNLNDSGAGSLRQAVIDANTAGGDDIVAFQSGLSGTINLTGADSDIEIYSDGLTIQGPGAGAVTVDGGGSDRIFFLYNFNNPNEPVTISGLTLRDGDADSGNGGALYSDDLGGEAAEVTLSAVVMTGNTANTGGAIWVDYGSLTIVDSTLSDNHTPPGGDAGGVLYMSDSDGDQATELVIRNSTFSGNTAGSNGGAIQVDSMDSGVLIDQTTFSNNRAEGGNGGAVFITDASGDVTIQASTVTGNFADRDSGGVYAYDNTGDVTVSGSTFAGNEASTGYAGGAAFYDNGGDVRISTTTFSGNRAGDGGGGLSLWGNDGLVLMESSTVSGNVANTDGDAAGYGGGFNSYNHDADLDVDTERIIRNSTIVDNSTSSSDGGGGIYANLFDNPGAPDDVLQIKSTIVANNSAPDGADLGENDGTVTGNFDLAFSLVESPETGAAITETPAGSNILNTDPQLGPLQNNGGPTQTMLPALTSPAIDAGASNGLTTDQRGLPRTADLGAFANRAGSDGTDIGAVEIAGAACQGATVPSKTGTDGNDTLTGTEGADAIAALAGNDSADGLAGADCVSGDDGDDTVKGGPDNDQVLGGDGKDKGRGQGGKDTVKGEAGKDNVAGGGANDKVVGGDGKDTVKGGGGKDKVKGNAGADKLKARDGAKDKVNCGSGDDKAVVDDEDKVAKNCEDVTVG